MADISRLLDRSFDDAQVQELVRDLGPCTVGDEAGEGAYHQFMEAGVSLFVDLKERVKTIFLYPEGRDGFTAYAGEIPGGITFADRQPDVTGKLGPASRSGGGGKSALYGSVPQWARYDRPDHSLHFEFAGADGAVSLITLMSPDTVP